MSRTFRRSAALPCGWVTLALTFVFVLVFRIEQNIAYVLGISSRQLIGLDVFPVGAVVQVLAPFLHANATHLVSTLIWVIPFGYLLERRRHWKDYVGFVILAGVLSTTFGPALFVILGVTDGLAVGGSGITYALVGREATARVTKVGQWRSFSWMQWGILTIVVLGFLVKLVSFVSGTPAGTSVVGHFIGLIVGISAGIREQMNSE